MEKLELGPAELKSLAATLLKVEFLANLNVADLNRILSYVQLFSYEPGELIFKQGRLADAFFIIYEGQVEVRVKKYFIWPAMRLGLLSAGQFFGETALIDRGPRNATIKALSPAKIFVFLSDDFDLVIQNNPSFAEIVKKVSSQRKFHTRSATA